jgi:hypothetical protein
MEQFATGMLAKERIMSKVRTILHDIEDCALSTHLQRVYEALRRMQNVPVAIPITCPAVPSTALTSNPSLVTHYRQTLQRGLRNCTSSIYPCLSIEKHALQNDQGLT